MMLYEHQKRIIADDKKKTGLWLGTGSGKTRIALELAQGSILIICPKTQRDDKNWQRENHKNKNITVVSKEDFKKLSSLNKLTRFDTVIIDEAHTVAGATPAVRFVKKQAIPKVSQTFQAIYDYLKQYPPNRLYLLTATPIRSPMSVWALAKLLGNDWDFYKFRQTFYVNTRMNNHEVWVPKKDTESKERLANSVKKLGYVGRLEEYFDVPDQIHKKIYVDLTKEQQARLRDIEIEYPEPIVQCGKRNQIENGVLAGDTFNKPEYFKNEKIEKILDLALEFPRMIIFARYREQIKMISEALKEEGYKVLVITGDTKNRGEVLAEANASKGCVLIVSAQISAGWEWKECPCMVFASRTYSFVDYSQSLGRVQRADNIKKNIYIYLITKGKTVDNAVDKCLEDKSDFNEKLFI